MTQHQKILDFHAERKGWVCGNEYRTTLWIFSPHKRRQEIEDHETSAVNPDYEYRFEDRPCTHGQPKVLDYYLHITSKERHQASFFPVPEKPKQINWAR